MPAEVAAIVLSLISAAFWGAGDFTGGLTTKQSDVFGVVIVAHFAGFVLLVGLALFSGEAIPPTDDLLWSAAAGIAGVIGLAAFYRGLSLGNMGLIAPITAVLATSIPVVFTIFTDGLPDALKVLGFMLALIGVWFVSRGDGLAVISRRGLQLAIIGALGFGGFFILIDQAETTSVVWKLIAARGGSTLFMIALALMLKRRWLPDKKYVPAMVMVGLLDLGGNAFFVLAEQQGRLDVAAVLSSLYPAVTILLARILLQERLSPHQLFGIAAALVAIMLIAV
ncbi:MAG: DMT family transporter [Aggregatilineales bacterium]